MSEFETNLLKMIAAELHFLSAVSTSRELYGKSYFSLGASEKVAVDQMVFGLVGSNYVGITPEMLKSQTTTSTAGFQAPPPPGNRQG
jgi:hypothetical protein